MVTLFRTLIFLLVNSAVYTTSANDLEIADKFLGRPSNINIEIDLIILYALNELL